MKTMKFYLSVLVAFALVACTDDRLDTGKPTIEDDGMLTFVFPGIAKGSTTYATVGSAEENKLETLDIYVFTEHPNSAEDPKPMVLEEVFLSGEDGFDFQTSGNDKIAKIKVAPGNKKQFFFIANGRQYYGQNSVVLFQTTAADFIKKANILGAQHIACPLEMSADTLIEDMSALTSPIAIDVTLTRRVARFDVKNDSEDSGFIVDEILIFNAPTGANVFASYDAVLPYKGPVTAQLEPIDFSVYPNSNHGTSNSVFYLAPTLDTDPGTNRELSFQLIGRSTTNLTPQIYPVKIQQPDGTPIQIKANHLYTVHILNMGIGYINASLEVKDWTYDSDNDVDNPASYGTIKLMDVNGDPLPNNHLTLDADDLSEQTILVEADTEWEIVVEPQYYWIEHNGDQLTESKVYKEFKIKANSANPRSTKDRRAVIAVQNKKRPSIVQKFILQQKPNADRHIDVSGPYYTDITFATGRIELPGEMTKQFALNVDVLAGTDWTASIIGDMFQIAYDPSPAQGPGKLLLTPKANLSGQIKRDTLTIETQPSDPDEKLILKIPVAQAVANLGTIRLDAAGLNTNTGIMTVEHSGFSGGKRSVRVFAHTDWEVVVTTNPADQDWATVSVEPKGTPTGLFNGSFNILATPNTGDEREATITVKNTIDGDNIYATITLKQKKDPTYTP